MSDNKLSHASERPALPQGAFAMLFAVGLLLALGLRFLNLDAASVWIDETYSLMVANVHRVPETLTPVLKTAAQSFQERLAWQPMRWDALLDLLKINVHMPLYYLLLNPWLKAFGTTVVGLRSFSVLFSTLALIPIAILAAKFRENPAQGRRLALLTLFVGAVLPFQLYFAQEGRMYTLALFWSTLSALSFWQVVHGDALLRRRWTLLHALSTTLGLFSHYLFVFYLSFQAGYFLYWLRVGNLNGDGASSGGKQSTRTIAFLLQRFGWTFLSIGLLALLWGPVYLAQQHGVDTEYHFAKGLVSLTRYLSALVWQPLMTVTGDNPLERSFYIPVALALGVLAIKPTFSKREAVPPHILFILCWIFIPLGVQIAYDLIKHTHTVVIDRYILLISPAMILLLALGLERLWSLGRTRLASALMTCMLLLGVANVWQPSPFRDEHNKRDLKSKFAYMLQNVRPDDLVFVNGPIGAENLAAYYLHEARPQQLMLYWMTPYRGVDVPLPSQVLFRPYQRVWLFRNRANNERGLQQAKVYLRTMFPKLLETEEKHDWWLMSR